MQCGACQRAKPSSARFRVSREAGNLRSNEQIYMDILYIGRAPVLHVSDSVANFSTARFSPNFDTAAVWATFFECRPSVYTGLPNRIRVDRSFYFSCMFLSVAIGANSDVCRSDLETHSSLMIGERYRQPMRNTFRKAELSMASHIPESSILSMSAKPLNGRLGPKGFVPSALVLGAYPSTHVLEDPRDPYPTLQERSKLASIILKEMNEQMARVHASGALQHNVPASSDAVFETGGKVLVFRQNRVTKRIGESFGPFTVIATDNERKLI